MGPFLKLVAAVVRSFPGIFQSPTVDLLYLVVLGLVASQYARVQSTEERLFGRAKNRALHQTLVSVGMGFIGGLFASILLVMIGVTLNESGVSQLLPLALILFLISPRFLCYSYAGGLASLGYLMFGWPKVNVPVITALVACLHAAESLLIYLSGHSCSTPLYVSDRDGNVVGGFALQRFWPIPLLVLMMIRVPDISRLQGILQLPDWWPLIGGAPPSGLGTPVYHMMPVIAALGYSDLAVARGPREKSRRTSLTLFAFSAILLALSIASTFWPAFAWVAALFSPLGHEVVVRLGVRDEFARNPRYPSSRRLLVVMDVLDQSLAHKAGIRPGNVIISAQGVPVFTRDELQAAIAGATEIALTFVDGPGAVFQRRVVLTRNAPDEPLGIITAPQVGDEPLARSYSEGPLVRLLKRIVLRTSRQ